MHDTLLVESHICELYSLLCFHSNYSGVGKSLLSCKPLFNDDQVSVVLPQATTLSTDCSGGEREESCTNNSENDGSAMKGVNVQMNVPKLLVLAETAAVQQCNGPFKTSNAKSPHCCHGSGDECEGVSHCGTVTTVPPWFIPDGGKLEVVIVLKARYVRSHTHPLSSSCIAATCATV